MLEILESLATVVIMVPVMIALLLGSIYGLGELFNLFSAVGGKRADAEIMFEGRNAPRCRFKVPLPGNHAFFDVPVHPAPVLPSPFLPLSLDP